MRKPVHKKAHEVENYNTASNNGEHDNKAILGEKSEFKELPSKWNQEGAGHDADNDKNQNRAPEVEGFGNPIDKIKVDGKGDKHRGGSKFEAREILVVRNDGEC